MHRAPSHIRFLLTVPFVALLTAAACAPSPCADTEPDAPARRIVSLMPALTETLVELGASDRIVGLDRFSPVVPGRPDLPRLGDAFSVSLESLMALEPDAVLVNHQGLVEKLQPVAHRTRVVTLPTDTLAQVRETIARLARITQREQEGERLLRTIDRALDEARGRAAARRARGIEPPSVLVVVQHRPWHVAGGASYVHELLTVVGARNVVGDLDEPWPAIGEETIVARAPRVILDTSTGNDGSPAAEAVLAEWKRFPTIPAVRDGRVVPLEGDALFRPGPRIPKALLDLERLLFGPEDDE